MHRLLRVARPLVAMAGLFCYFCAQAQEIPVDLYTGTPSIQVPLWTATHHDINIPVSLSYSTTGLSGKQGPGNFGSGWNLGAASYSVKRQVRSFPDDWTGENTDLRRGWLYTRSGGGGVAAEVHAFNDNADNSSATCSDETSSYTTLAGWNALIDTEPDIFSFSGPGLSGSFVFDKESPAGIHTIPYMDVQITPTYAAGSKRITSFTIKTNDGFLFTFGQAATTSKQLRSSWSTLSPITGDHALNQYMQPVSYAYEWKLTRIDSPSGAFANFIYVLQNEDGSVVPFHVAMYGNTYVFLDGGYVPFYYGYKHKVVEGYETSWGTRQNYMLSKITGSSGGEIEFTRGGELVEKITIRDMRRQAGDEFVKEFSLQYYDELLKSVSEYSGCERKPPYRFYYVRDARGALRTNPAAVTDYWGYFNGYTAEFSFSRPSFSLMGDLIPELYVYPDEPPIHRYRLFPIPGYTGTSIILPGTKRQPVEASMKLSALYRIDYPAGGGVGLQWEAHQYYDERAGINQQGGGLRIKAITEFDGTGQAGHITKTFEYTVPDMAGRSSGKLMSLPQFATPAWRYRDPNSLNDASRERSYASLSGNQQIYDYLTIRSEEDMSSQEFTHGSAVGYQYATVKRTNAGRAEYEFAVPGSVGQTTSGEWQLPAIKISRSTNCPTVNLFPSTDPWLFTFTGTPEIDHERGLELKKKEYNNDGLLVRQTQTDYQTLYKTGTTSYKVYGVQYDQYANATEKIFFYRKYYQPTDYTKVVSKQTVTTYEDLNNYQKVVEVTDYYYESTSHKMLSRIKRTTGDGTELTTRLKYVLDFGTIAANSEPALLRIKDLQTQFRHGMPIEQWTSRKPAGGTEKVAAASIILLSDFGQSGKVFTQSAKALSIAAPVTDFAASAVVLNSGTYTLQTDSRYEEVNAVSGYDPFGAGVGSVDISRVPSSTVWGYNSTAPIAHVVNAAKDEFGFTDLETTSSHAFTASSPTYYATPRTGFKGLHPYTKLSRTVTKANTASYILSFWVKSAAAINFSIAIKSTNLATTHYSTVYNHTPAGSDFQLVRQSIPTASLPATFVVELVGQSLAQPAGSSPTLLPAIDDVAFVPEEADLTSYTYTFPYGVSAITTPAGQTAYKDYDKLGRTIREYDQDKNIRTKNTYEYSNLTSVLDASFSTPVTFVDLPSNTFKDMPVIFRGEPITFTASGNSCIPGVVYEWDFLNNGTVVTGSSVATYTYTATQMNQVVKLRVSAPGLQTATTLMLYSIIPRPLNVSICANGAQVYLNGYGQSASNYNGCPAQPAPSSGTVFYASVAGGVSNPTYTWMKKFLDTTADAWFVVGTNSSSYSINQFSAKPEEQRDFRIKCIVTTAGNGEGESNELGIHMEASPQ